MSQEASLHHRPPKWYFVKFGLLVTGEGESKFLPKLFRFLAETTGFCSFEVIRKIEQLGPISSVKKHQQLQMEGKKIPNRDEERIGLPARRYLQDNTSEDVYSYVLLIDDLEQDRRSKANDVFGRYRLALDTILKDQKHRASVQFLVNMLEAYYFAHTQSINHALDLAIPLSDHNGDVEEIPHPKNQLKNIMRSRYNRAFDEIEHGEKIIELLDLKYILSEPQHCKSLRTLITWCIQKLEDHPQFQHSQITNELQAIQGEFFNITRGQLNA